MSHLYDVSIAKHDYYSVKAASQYDAHQAAEPRGVISFSSKTNYLIPAAVNKEIPYIYAAPAEVTVEHKKDFVDAVETILHRSSGEATALLDDSHSFFNILEESPSPELVAQVQNANVQGLHVGNRLMRYYPNNTLAANVLGFVADMYNNPHGQYGIEEEYQTTLGDKTNPADLVLTIDYNIQQEGESILDQLMQTWKADSGTVIVEEPSTGAILAMAQRPSFNPNTYSNFPVKNFLNQNISDVYEPGSVFKAITFASALDAGKITPETTYVDTGALTMSGYTIRNWDLKAYGMQTMVQVLQNSLNVGAAFIERQLGPDLFLRYVKEFGFGTDTGIDLPGEAAGNLYNLKGFEPLYFATASFGQGISVTPLQLIMGISALANHGILMKPYMVSSILYNDGTSKEIAPQEVKRVVSEDTAKKSVDALVSVVEHGIIGEVPGYRVAGKTGTAQIPSPKGGYEPNAYTDDYVGFAPADHPRFVILIKLVRPIGAPLSGATVVPAFRDFTKFLLDYYNIPPDQH